MSPRCQQTVGNLNCCVIHGGQLTCHGDVRIVRRIRKMAGRQGLSE
jgi:hypothetical protein